MLFTTGTLAIFLVLVGVAVDLAHVAAARAELQRSMDAAALAGAGKLAFDKSVFGTARDWATRFAAANAYHDLVRGTVSLDPNTANSPDGDVVMGKWASSQFTPWSSATDPNGTSVNAVRCRTHTALPTSFLRLLGLPTLTVSAMATAISNPPTSIGCGEAALPIAVTRCSFYDATTGAFTSSNGCGSGITFIRSQTLCDNSAGSSQICNTATWASLDGTNPETPYLNHAILAAAQPSSDCGMTFLQVGDSTVSNTGMLDPVYSTLADAFRSSRVVPLLEDVCPAGGCGAGVSPIYPKEKGGWPVVVMLIETPCPPAALKGTYRVLTWARFVVTQVFFKQDGCIAMPNPDPQANAYCYNPNGSVRKDNDLRAIFGYFNCGQLGHYATTEPAPRAALAPRLKLVQ
jgi:Flp pilus assembly protein TadG